MNKWIATFLVFIFLFLVALSLFFGQQIQKIPVPISPTPVSTSNSPVEDQPVKSVVVQNLEIPWGIAFLPDYSILVTERPGRVRIVDPQGVLRQEPLATITEVNAVGEGGLLGVAVHPEFESNRFVYLYYTYSNNSDNTLNRVVRFRLENNSLSDRTVLVDAIPGASNHDGGRIKFGPDGFLYITTGDSQEPSLSQDRLSLAGKILRVTPDGKPAPGNPFNTVIYSYGHRNSQGLTWDGQGRLWSTEHGRSAPTGLDELNRIESGKNYGWPVIQGDEKKEGMVTPILNSGPVTTWAPAGAAFYNGSIFFGGLRGQGLYEAVIQGDSATLKKHFDGELGRIRDVVLGPDKMLYITTSNRDGRGTPKENDDKIYRVNPSKL